MDSIDNICDKFLNVELDNIDEYNELVYYLNFQGTCVENIISALLNSNKRYKRYLHNINIWNINGMNNNDIPKDIKTYLSISLPEIYNYDNYVLECMKIKLDLMRKIDSRIFNILENLKN